MTSPNAQLGDVADFINGFAFKPEDWSAEGLPIIRIQNLTGNGTTINRTTLDVPTKYRVNKGDLLVSWSASLGVFQWEGPEAVVNQHIFKVVPKLGRVDLDYLRHAIDSSIHEMERFTHGSTMKHINRKEFLEHNIPLPSLDEQRRIAAILDKSDALRRKRKRALDLLDSLTQSIFLEMFGDPVSNPRDWPLVKLGDIIHKASDGPHVSPDYSESGIPFLSTRHVQKGSIVWEDLKFIDQAQAEAHWKKCRPERGDILYTKGGTTGLAAMVDTDDPFAVWVHVALLKPDHEQVEPLWLESMLNSEYCYRQSQRYTHGIANRDLGLTRMVKIQMYLPPKSEQKRFVDAATTLARIKKQRVRAAFAGDLLFSSLEHRAFSGHL